MIEIVGFDEHQAFKDGRPIKWIKLYRKLRHNRGWRQLSPEAAKLLIDLWLYAADEDHPGEVHDSINDLSFDLRLSVDDLQRFVQELESQGFIRSVRNRTESYESVRNRGLELEEEKELEKEVETTTPPVPPPSDVEKSDPGGSSGWVEVKKAATRELGLSKLSYKQEQTNASILRDWRYKQGRKPDDCLAAIRGACRLRDEETAWLEKGQPYTLAALYNTGTLADQGDGETVRPLWSVAQDRYYEENSCEPGPKRRRYGKPERITLESINL